MNAFRHLKILALLLLALGVGITFYQIFVLKTPLRENVLTDLWTIDARISFSLPEAKPVDLHFHLPPKGHGYDISNELFIANGYGQTTIDSGSNRVVQWTARKLSGQQTIFYRANFAKSFNSEQSKHGEPGETWVARTPLPETERIAADALLTEIRQKSTDTASFISTAIAKLEDLQDDNVKLLRGADPSPENKMRAVEKLLSQAHIPMQGAYLVRLDTDGVHKPELWARSYIEVTKENSQGWRYFNLQNGAPGLPDNRLLWWVGSEPIIKASGAVKPQVVITVNRSEMSVLGLQSISSGNDFSLYSLPLATQHAYRLMLMIPIGVFIILIVRNIVGLETLGTFTPVLIALAFRETGLVFGAIFFSVIIFMGLLLRAYLEHLKLQMLPRLSIVLTFVIMLIVAGSMLCYKIGFARGLAITLFPMVILTMSIERLSITWEERGGAHAFRVAIGTMVAAACVDFVLSQSALSYLVFTFPGLLLVMVVFMLGIGRYRGYRLSELIRFKDLSRKG